MRLISQQIRVFDAVVRRRSFTRAARELRMTQPAVSHHMRVLEETCGVKLVERVGNRVLPTEAGLALHDTARHLIGLEHDLEHVISGLKQGEHGTLAIGTDTTGGMNVLLRILASFRDENPDVDVRLRVASTDGVLDALTDRSIDLGVLRGTVSAKQFDVQFLCPDEVMFVVSKAHPLAAAGAVAIADIPDVPLILPGPGSTTRDYVAERFRDAGLSPRIAMEFESTEHTKKAVEANLGAGIISRWVIEPELASGSLVQVHVEGFPLMREYRLARRLNSPIAPVAVRFLSTVNEVKAQLHFGP
jgi:DNA-binding transcriptional LysR family regulator